MDNSPNPPPEKAPQQGWILYDGDCPLCTGFAGKFGSALDRHGFAMAPLQTPWVTQRLGLKPGEIPDEMKFLTSSGELFGGHHAFAQIARRIWWAWPIYAFSKLPGMDPLLKRGYRRLADRRHFWRNSSQQSSPPSWVGILRVGISAVWLFHGLFGKLLGLIPRHQLIVARILGEDYSWLMTKAIGAGEIFIAIWIASGIASRRCAAAQTILLIAMNGLEIAFVRDLLLAPVWMVSANLLLITAAWTVALRSRAAPVCPPASCPAKGR